MTSTSTDFNDQPTPVREGQGFDVAALEKYLGGALGVNGPLVVQQFGRGFSNLTYLLEAGDRELVLRRSPPGVKIKSAHDMGREFRILSRLADVWPKAPRPLAHCEDEAIIGTPFYVMERVRGVILRQRLPQGLVLDEETMRRVSRAMIDTLAEIHLLDFKAVGLGDLGKPDGYIARQVNGWAERYRKAQTDEVPQVEQLHAWLATNMPKETSASLIHNDFKYDNVVLAPDLSGVAAVLDWEMATLGDPLMDLGTTLGYWIDPDDPPVFQVMVFGPTNLPGNLRRVDLVRRYEEKTGRSVGSVLYYYVNALFKLAVVAQQLYKRYHDGLTKEERYAPMLEGVRAVTSAALVAIDKGRIDRLDGNMSMDAETVVVGAGSAGAVIAARATERSDREVLLLEAGPDYEDLRVLPRDLRDGTRNSMRSHDWGYRHRPLAGQVLFDLPRGRVVGGSSAVNTCIALRGHAYDYDEWAAMGLTDWSFEACLPAFKRLENDLDFGGDEWHGDSGPIPVRRHPRSELVPWQGAFIDACLAMGFEDCPDHNAPTGTGIGPSPMNKIDGVRQSAARCYLTSTVRARPNLRIRARTLVRRVLFEGRRVRGLEVEDESGRVETIRSRRVILAAGAIATPGILLRSGVGPRRSVERIGVDLVSDVPAVAARLLDHPGAAFFLVPRPGVSVPTHLIQTMLRFTSTGSPYPDDMKLQAGSFVPLPRNVGVVPLVSIMCGVGKPRGHGRLEMTSADPRAMPRIESELLHHPTDKAAAVEAMELAWLCATSKEMRGLASFVFPSERTMARRASIAEWIVKSCDSGYHPCGTVPMGLDSDDDAAVDGRGRVRGVSGLHVADASIMPTIPSANTNFPTLMIGERFGEWLREGAL